jgi:ribonucleoside-diphosphate reductase alpha chain
MHLRKHPSLEKEIRSAFDLVRNKKVLPSMRSMQFGGKPIEIANNRIYNCAYMPIDDIKSFSESMFLLLGGTGVGYSVQKRKNLIKTLHILFQTVSRDGRMLYKN